MRTYILPDLGYDYGALEPHISGRIMELHHGRHHAGYVKNVNQLLERLTEAGAAKDPGDIAALERSLAFNLSGHVLHSIFWRNLAPRGGGRPEGDLAQALHEDFGGFDPFRRKLSAAAATLMGSGWAALAWEPVGRRLVVTQIYDHQSNTIQGTVPLMVLDGWEHAYYLQYENQKNAFFEAVWNLWNWEDIGARHAVVRALDPGLPGCSE
jgi:Fe-Mn family superoxide dismutase